MNIYAFYFAIELIFLLTFIELFVIIVAYETVAFATIKKSRGTLCQNL